VRVSGSNYAWVCSFQGGRFDPVSGLLNFRRRDYSAQLGRWNRVDPIGFRANDADMYRFVGDNPTNKTDPAGTGGPYDWITDLVLDIFDDPSPLPRPAPTQQVGPIGGPQGQITVKIYFGPWRCRKVWVDTCKKKCASQGLKFLGCVWIADINEVIEVGGLPVAAINYALTHCCCSYPSITGKPLDQCRGDWNKYRDDFRELWESKWGQKFPTTNGKPWPVHHVHDIAHGGKPTDPNNLIPLPPDVHYKVTTAYGQCYSGAPEWSQAGPDWPFVR
jgi:RHS repeat-associated protein